MYKQCYGEKPTGELLHLALQIESNRIERESHFAEHFDIDPRNITQTFFNRFDAILRDVQMRIPEQIKNAKESKMDKKPPASKMMPYGSGFSGQGLSSRGKTESRGGLGKQIGNSFDAVESMNSDASLGFTKIDLTSLLGRVRRDSFNDDIFASRYADMIEFFGLLQEDSPEGRFVALRAIYILKKQVSLLIQGDQDVQLKSESDKEDALMRKDVKYILRRYNQARKGMEYRLKR